MAAHTSIALPSKELLGTYREAVSEAADVLDSFEAQLQMLSNDISGNLERVPVEVVIDDAYIGMLYRFVSEVKCDVERLTRSSGLLEQRLVDLDLDGRDLDLARVNVPESELMRRAQQLARDRDAGST